MAWSTWTAALAWAEALVDWHAATQPRVWPATAAPSRAEVRVLVARAVATQAARHPPMPVACLEDLGGLELGELYTIGLAPLALARDVADPLGAAPTAGEPGCQAHTRLARAEATSPAWRMLAAHARAVVLTHLLLAEPSVQRVRLRDRHPSNLHTQTRPHATGDPDRVPTHSG